MFEQLLKQLRQLRQMLNLPSLWIRLLFEFSLISNVHGLSCEVFRPHSIL